MKKQSDKMLTILFSGMVVLPLLSFPITWNRSDFDEMENKQLAKFPSDVNVQDFPTAFNTYFNDHLPMRSQYKTIWATLNYRLFHDTVDQRVVVGQEEGNGQTWLFYDASEDGDPLKEAQGVATYDVEEMETMYDVIARNEETVADYGFQLYYFAGPNKESVYFDKLPKAYQQFDPLTRQAKLVNWLKDEKGFDNYIYPLEELKEASRQGQTYYRQDIHWNAYGGYVGYQAFMKKAHPELDAAFIEDASISYGDAEYLETDLVKLSGIRNVFNDEVPEVLFHEDYDVANNRTMNDTVVETICDDAPIKKTVFLIGDSFREELMPYLSKTYQHCFFMHRKDYYTIYLDWFWPDEIILESVERYTSANMSVLLKGDEETYPVFD